MVLAPVTSEVLNSTSGQIEEATILSVAMPRATVNRLNFSALDPSDSLTNFVHQMSFKKTKGFEVVAAITAARFTDLFSPLRLPETSAGARA